MSVGASTHSVMSHSLSRGGFPEAEAADCTRSTPEAIVGNTMEAFGKDGGGVVVSRPHINILLKGADKDVSKHPQTLTCDHGKIVQQMSTQISQKEVKYS